MDAISEFEVQETVRIVVFGEVAVAVTALMLGEKFDGLDIGRKISKRESMWVNSGKEMELGNHSMCLAALCAGQLIRYQLAVEESTGCSKKNRILCTKIFPRIEQTHQHQFDEFNDVISRLTIRSKRNSFIRSIVYSLFNIERTGSDLGKMQAFEMMIKEIEIGLYPLAPLIDEVVSLLLKPENSCGQDGWLGWELVASCIKKQLHLLNLRDDANSYSMVLQRIHPTRGVRPYT